MCRYIVFHFQSLLSRSSQIYFGLICLKQNKKIAETNCGYLCWGSNHFVNYLRENWHFCDRQASGIFPFSHISSGDFINVLKISLSRQYRVLVLSFSLVILLLLYVWFLFFYILYLIIICVYKRYQYLHKNWKAHSFFFF